MSQKGIGAGVRLPEIEEEAGVLAKGDYHFRAGCSPLDYNGSLTVRDSERKEDAMRHGIAASMLVCLLGWTASAHAELYVAGELGATFPNDITNITATGAGSGTLTDLKLKDSLL